MPQPQVGQTVQFFTSRLDRQVEGVGPGPYAAIVTRYYKGSMVDLLVLRPGNVAPYFAGSVTADQDVHVDANPRMYWRAIPAEEAPKKPDVFVPAAGSEDEVDLTPAADEDAPGG